MRKNVVTKLQLVFFPLTRTPLLRKNFILEIQIILVLVSFCLPALIVFNV